MTTETRYTRAKTNPWRYTGQHFETTTGLYKMGARYYQPEIVRWTQRDPSGPGSTFLGALGLATCDTG